MNKFNPYNIMMRTVEESKCGTPCGRHVLGVYEGIEDGVVPSGGRRAVLGQEAKRR